MFFNKTTKENEPRSLQAQTNTYYHKVRIYKEYHSVCPLIRIGTNPTPLSPASVPLPPELGRGKRSPAGEGLGESQFRRLEKKLSTLLTLCLYYVPSRMRGWGDTCAVLCAVCTMCQRFLQKVFELVQRAFRMLILGAFIKSSRELGTIPQNFPAENKLQNFSYDTFSFQALV